MKSEYPQYRSHKIVRAAEIENVTYDATHDTVTFTFRHGLPHYTGSSKINQRYAPASGDFLMFYEDGYVSISPRKAFLDGYSLYDEDQTCAAVEADVPFIQKALWFTAGGAAATVLAVMTVLILVYLNTH